METSYSEYPFTSLLHKKALILGDIQAGKTSLTAHLLKEAVKAAPPETITVIDMAPEKFRFEGRLIGGRLGESVPLPAGVKLLQPAKIHAPRATAKSREELLTLVEKNRRSIEKVLNHYISSPTAILFINDASLYLQSGAWKKLVEAMKRSDTSIANAYYGESLRVDHDTGVSELERRLVEKLTRYVDLVIRL